MCSVSLVVCRLMMPVISLCAVLAHGPEVLAQDEVSLLRRGLTAYKEYTNIRITGTGCVPILRTSLLATPQRIERHAHR